MAEQSVGSRRWNLGKSNGWEATLLSYEKKREISNE